MNRRDFLKLSGVASVAPMAFLGDEPKPENDFIDLRFAKCTGHRYKEYDRYEDYEKLCRQEDVAMAFWPQIESILENSDDGYLLYVTYNVHPMYSGLTLRTVLLSELHLHDFKLHEIRHNLPFLEELVT